MNRREFLKVTGAGLLSLTATNGFGAVQEHKRPNIIVMVADDMGFSDPGCYGGEIATPNLDRLAANGLRFTQFYNCARCCPTRASLLTGLYPHQVGLTRNGQSLTHDGVTIAEALRQAGYNTAMAGKWHLSFTPVLPDPDLQLKWLNHQYSPGPLFAPLDSYPVKRGFDRFYGVIWGVINHFDPFSLVEGTDPVETVPKDYYFGDAITDKAIEYVRDFAASDKPFFLYYAHCEPHWPLHAWPEDIDKYKNTYLDGWDTLRRDRFKRQLDMGLFDKSNTPLPPVHGNGPKWSALSDQQKSYESAKMAVHAAMVDRIDQNLGRLLKALEETGQLDNTLIVFFSDNGASPEIMHQPGYDRNSETRDGRKVHYDPAPQELLGSELSYTGIGSYWANAANTPFRYWKKESFEGGCHTPMIAHWPAGLKTRPGTITAQVGHVIDLLPTCLQVAGAAYPKTYQEHTLLPLEGESLLPILNGQTRPPHPQLYFEHEGGKAMRMGDWKLVAHSRNGQWELYNLAEDKTETRNLADQFPEKVEQMKADWQRWARKMGLKAGAQG